MLANKLDNNKKWEFPRDRVVELLSFLALVAISERIVSYLLYGMETLYQVNRDAHFFKSAAWVCVMVLIIRKANIFKWPTLVLILGYSIYFYQSTKILTPEYCGAEYRDMEIMRLLSLGFFLVVIIDTITQYEKYKVLEKKEWFTIVTFIVLSLIIGLNYSYSSAVLIPTFALYLTKMKRKDWIHFIDAFCIGYYISFAHIFTKSIIEVPYHSGVFGNHYYGIFLNLATAEAFCLGATICAAYGIIRAKQLDNPFLQFCCFAMLIYPTIAAFLFAERSGVYAIIAVFALLFIFFRSDEEKRSKWIRRAWIIIICCLVGLLLSIGGLYYLCLLDVDELLAKTSNNYLWYTLTMLHDRALNMMNKESLSGIFPDGSIVNSIDHLLSWRLSYYVDSLQKTTWLGGTDMTVGNEFFESTNPHCTYLAWLRMYGWFGGGLLIVWFVTAYIRCIKQILKGSKEVVFPFMWMSFFSVYSLVETALWKYTMGYILLIIIYPLFISFVDENMNSRGKEE